MDKLYAQIIISLNKTWKMNKKDLILF